MGHLQEERGSRIQLVGDAGPGRASSLGAGRTIVPVVFPLFISMHTQTKQFAHNTTQVVASGM